MPRSKSLLAFLVLLLSQLPAIAEKPKPVAATEPEYIDDDEIYDDFMAKLRVIAQSGKHLAADKLKAFVSEDRPAKISLPKPASTARLEPEDVYRQALPSVFLLGSVIPDSGEKGEGERPADGYLDGRMATAWVLSADGLLMTNWHVFDEIEDGETFGVMDRRGRSYPVTDVVIVNKTGDFVVFRVAATGLTPLPLAERAAPVGAWIGVIGHPGDRYFTFTQGTVTRYTKVKLEDERIERWMGITADYAYGSSGSPVLDRTGSVVGMAALTESLDYPEPEETAPPPAADKKPGVTKPADESRPEVMPPADKGSPLQMVIKLAVPATEIRKSMLGK